MRNSNENTYDPNMIQEETVIGSVGQPEETVKRKSGSGFWKAVTIGGIPGVAMGVAGTLGTQKAAAAAVRHQAEEENNNEGESGETPVDSVKVAESVNDDMSFGEAFAAARHEVGAGGVFEWRGNLYNTYLKEEWDSMSPAEKHEFAGRVADYQRGETPDDGMAHSGAGHHVEIPDELHLAQSVDDDMSFGEAFAAARHEVGAGGLFEWRGHLYNTFQKEEWESLSSEQQHEYAGKVAEVHEDLSHAQNSQPDGPDEDLDPGDEPLDDVQFEIVNVETVHTEDGTEVHMAEGIVDGHGMVMIDVNGDGFMDSVIVDTNDNGEIEDTEVADIQGCGIHVDLLNNIAQANYPEQIEGPNAADDYSDIPDYTDDADSSSLV